ncbi:ribonuclease H-like domain-containing protein [Flammula alnicola]|nr:ribonuclease H-like domain-containing protein [Flammula alnicola]
MSVTSGESSGSSSTSSLSLGQAPIIDKSPPRPAPTSAYSWKDYNPKAKVLYIRDHKEANLELSKLPRGPQALGFDLEWKPTFVKGGGENPVALVQLANNDTIFLLQVSAMKEFPSSLVQVLADPLIVKTGVAIQNDAKKLHIDFHVHMYNCVDLSLLARTVDNARWQGKYNSSLGLARLIESYEYRLLGKGKITRSNWEAYLSPQQIEYASNDAHAGHTLYRKLEAMVSALQTPERVWFSFNLVSGQLLTPDGFVWHPVNPNYDPGPPPPPRVPREKTDNDTGTESQNTGEASSSVAKKPIPDWKNNKRKRSYDLNNNRSPNHFYGQQRYGRTPAAEATGPASNTTRLHSQVNTTGRSNQQQQIHNHGPHALYQHPAVQAPFQVQMTAPLSTAPAFSNAQYTPNSKRSGGFASNYRRDGN